MSGAGSRPSPDVSVVLPCRDGATTLAAQLEALAGQVGAGGAGFEVVLVDHRSTDGSAELAREQAGAFAAPLALRVVPAERPGGVGYVRNVGTAAARGDRVLYCDADDVVRPGWVAAMAAALELHDVVGGVLDVARINGGRALRWTDPPPADALPVAMGYRPYATGASLGVRRGAWVALGGFDESFVGGHEEVDFCWRALDHGLGLGFAPDAVVDYRLREDLRAMLRQRFGYGRTYAQLYARFRTHPIPRCSVREELGQLFWFALDLPRARREDRLDRWYAQLAWTTGRWAGNLTHRVRSPSGA